MTKRKSASINQGIQARVVKAEVMAVGDRSRAVKTITHSNAELLRKSLDELRAELMKLQIEDSTKEAIQKDLSTLETITAAPETDLPKAQSTLTALAAKVKSIGEIAAGAAALIEPIKQIAGQLGLGLKLIGLG